MGIFCRRPLAMFSFIFLISALSAYYVSNGGKILIAVLLAVIAAIIIIVSSIIKKGKVAAVTASVCLLTVVFSFVHSLLFIGIPTDKAASYTGENTALCYIIDEEYTSDYSKKYDVKIKRIGEQEVSIRALLVCGFDAELSEGEEIYGLSYVENRRGESPEQLVRVYMDDADGCYIRRTSEEKGIFELLFSDCGVELLCGKLSDFIRSRLYQLLGEEKGALAMGFFTGERSHISTEITRDFRRVGVSHIMAVSGSHIAILLGGIELILKKLCVHKNARCIVVTVFSFMFLFITGFSLSACRSVFMLYAVYVGYFTYEESDPLTSLFVSVAVITVIFPYSVVDLGLWMSFLATLGLLTVYPIIEEKIPYPRKMKKPLKRLLRAGRELLLVALMTVTANMFLLPIIWYFFGEFSLVAVLSNILITLPSSAFLLSVPLLLLLSGIPFIGTVLKCFVYIIAEIILRTVELCSRLPNATVSLRYGFCTVIVILFAVSLAVLLLIKIKKKLFLFLPYLCATVAFVGCFFAYSLWFSSSELSYVTYNGNELFIVTENTDIVICDNTSGGMSVCYNVYDELGATTATEIDKYIFTHFHKGHISSFDLLSQNVIVRTIYMPMPSSAEDAVYAERLWNIAKEKGIQTVIYENGSTLELIGDVKMQALFSDSCSGGRYISFWSDGESVVYSTPEYCSAQVSYDTLILGGHGTKGNKRYDLSGITAKNIYISSKNLSEQLVLPPTENILIPAVSNGYSKISFEFGKN